MLRACALSAKSKWELREAETHLGQRRCGRANRPNTNPQPTGQFRLKSALDPRRASTQSPYRDRGAAAAGGSVWAPDRDGFEGLAHQLVVVAVGPVDHRPKGHAAAVGQQRALDPALAAVGRIAAGFFPTQRRLAHRSVQRQPPPVNALQRRHRPAVPRARTPRTHPPPAIPGSAGGPRRTSRSGLAQRIPLTPRPQHEEDRIHCRPVRHPRVVAAQRVLRPCRQQRLHLGPQRVRQPPTVIPNPPFGSSVKSFSPSQIGGGPLHTFLLG